MKKNLLIIIWVFTTQLNATAQSKNGIENYNLLSKQAPYVWMPIVHYRAKKGFYTEARYNYEELRTGSVYMGKSFSKEGNISYTVTPMGGIVFGDFNGGSIALNFDAEYKKYFFSMQTQYTISKDDASKNFYFNWSEVGINATDWLFTGISSQFTKLKNQQSSPEFGVLVGLSIGKLSIPVYIFNPFNNSRNFTVGINAEW